MGTSLRGYLPDVHTEHLPTVPPPFRYGIKSDVVNRIRTHHAGYMREFAESQGSIFGAIFAIIFQFAWIGLIAINCIHFSAKYTDYVIPIYLAACFLIGSRQNALGRMLHECAHGTFVASPRGNAFFGQLLSMIDLADWEMYCYEHSTHHRFLGHPTLDIEMRNRKKWLATQDRFYWNHFIKPISLFHLHAYLKPVIWCTTGSTFLAISRLVLISAVLVTVHLHHAWFHFLLFYAVPYLSTYQVFRYWSDSMDHAGLLNEDEYFLRTRNHISRFFFVNWLVCPRASQYQLVHQLFPWLPSRAFGVAHRHLMEMEPDYLKRAHSMEFSRKEQAD